ncbi:methyltransferase FkbM family [Chloroherpeton thalassium ATCC 35110]|uniref:Methyltransferase FkbM family n=1 Tax=Chloroherpeton thalassium (strain ATCC 35110 / GB-78) TaxID=517418 RepID=B3QT69_CHLT3|nr:FkbM family methyltransferase [Chloroherpeton thalassium]ACF14168.1 methyltransferase FkbM family [Chloroherpeton thalassium ATCC 35110]
MPNYIKKITDTLQNEGVGPLFQKVEKTIKQTIEERTFKPYFIQKVYEGETYAFLIGDLCGKDWYDCKTDTRKSKPETRFLKEKLLRKGDFVIDCGAHHGLVSMMCAKAVGEKGKVIAFEGLPKNTEIARKNVELNHISNLEIRNQAVGEKSGKAKFVVSSNGAIAKNNDFETVEVDVIALDDVFQNNPPDVLKVDVEGAEVAALRGAKNILKTYPKIDLEIHCTEFDDRIASITSLLNIIEMDKYTSYIQLRIDGEIVEFDQAIHTPSKIAEYPNVHLFCIPKK